LRRIPPRRGQGETQHIPFDLTWFDLVHFEGVSVRSKRSPISLPSMAYSLRSRVVRLSRFDTILVVVVVVRWLRGRLGESIAVSTSRVAHTAGPQRKGGVGGEHEEERGEDHEEDEVMSSSPYSTEDRGYKVGERRDDVGWAVAEWWVIASATRGFVLTRGSSFGLTAAALGLACSSKSLINAATPHPVVPGSACTSTSEVYTVSAHARTHAHSHTTNHVSVIDRKPDTQLNSTRVNSSAHIQFSSIQPSCASPSVTLSIMS
jgi:hypothetical protein